MLFSYFVFSSRKQHHSYPTFWGISPWELQQMISAPYHIYPGLPQTLKIGWELLFTTSSNSWNSSSHCSFTVGRHPWQGPSGSKQMPPTLTSLWYPCGDSQSHPHPSPSSSNPVPMSREELLRSRVFVADNDWGQLWNFQRWLKKHGSEELLEEVSLSQEKDECTISTHTHCELLKLLESVLNYKHCLQASLFS